MLKTVVSATVVKYMNHALEVDKLVTIMYPELDKLARTFLNEPLMVCQHGIVSKYHIYYDAEHKALQGPLFGDIEPPDVTINKQNEFIGPLMRPRQGPLQLDHCIDPIKLEFVYRSYQFLLQRIMNQELSYKSLHHDIQLYDTCAILLRYNLLYNNLSREELDILYLFYKKIEMHLLMSGVDETLNDVLDKFGDEYLNYVKLLHTKVSIMQFTNEKITNEKLINKSP